MRAVVITSHGAPDVLQVQERPDPPRGPGQVRVAVRAAGVNFADVMARIGPLPRRAQAAVRRRLRGGRRGRRGRRGRTDRAVGDRVMAGTRFGGYAEQVVVAAPTT